MKNFKVVVCGVLGHGKSTFCHRVVTDYEALKAVEKDIESPVAKTLQLVAESTDGPSIWNQEETCPKHSRVQYLYTNYARIEVVDHFGGQEAFDKLASSFLTADHISLVVDGTDIENEEIFFYLKLALRLTKGLISVLVNKMDEMDWQELRYQEIKNKVRSYLTDEEKIRVICLPIAAAEGANIYLKPAQMPWYKGDSVFQSWRRSFSKKKRQVSKTAPLFFVQRSDTFKDHGLFQGVLLQGEVQVGDPLLGLPNHCTTSVKKIFNYDQECKNATIGTGVTFITSSVEVLGSQFLVQEALDFHIANKVTARFFLWGGPLKEKGHFTLKHYSKVFQCQVLNVHDNTKRSQHLNESVIEFELTPQFTYKKVNLSTGLGTFSVCDKETGQPVGLGIL